MALVDDLIAERDKCVAALAALAVTPNHSAAGRSFQTMTARRDLLAQIRELNQMIADEQGPFEHATEYTTP